MQYIKQVDFFRKVDLDNVETKTKAGAFYSILGFIIAIGLFWKEYNIYKTPIIQRDFLIDSVDHEYITVFANITFFSIPCLILGVDSQDNDYTGEHINVVGQYFKKIRLTQDGDVIPNYFGHDMPKNYIDSSKEREDLYKALKTNEMCRVEGSFPIKKSPGNFHFSTHQRQSLIDSLQKERMDLYSHIKLDYQINELYFGNYEDQNEEQDINQQQQLLSDHTEQKQMILDKYFNFNKTDYAPFNKATFFGDRKYEYENYVQILPLKFEYPNIKKKSDIEEIEKISDLYQFNMLNTKIPKELQEKAEVYFRYEVSPINVTYTLQYYKTYHFIIQILAIIGGVFAVLGMIAQSTQNILTFLKNKLNN